MKKKKNLLKFFKKTLFPPCKLGSTLLHVELLGFSEYLNGISSEFAYCVLLILDKFSSNTDIDDRNVLRSEEEGDIKAAVWMRLRKTANATSLTNVKNYLMSTVFVLLQ